MKYIKEDMAKFYNQAISRYIKGKVKTQKLNLYIYTELWSRESTPIIFVIN